MQDVEEREQTSERVTVETHSLPCLFKIWASWLFKLTASSVSNEQLERERKEKDPTRAIRIEWMTCNWCLSKSVYFWHLKMVVLGQKTCDFKNYIYYSYTVYITHLVVRWWHPKRRLWTCVIRKRWVKDRVMARTRVNTSPIFFSRVRRLASKALSGCWVRRRVMVLRWWASWAYSHSTWDSRTERFGWLWYGLSMR